MTFARAAPPAYDEKGHCYAGRRQTNYLTQWTQASQISNKLTTINRPLDGQPGKLHSGFALHLFVINFCKHFDICMLAGGQQDARKLSLATRHCMD